MKKLILALPVLALSINSIAATRFDICYNLSCPKGFSLEIKKAKSGKNLLGSAAGIRECVSKKGQTKPVTQAVNYSNCSNKPCNSLPECEAYAAGQASCPAMAELAAVKAILNTNNAAHSGSKKATKAGKAKKLKLAAKPSDKSRKGKAPAAKFNLVLKPQPSSSKKKTATKAKLVLPKKKSK